jgi:hypothetical protein
MTVEVLHDDAWDWEIAVVNGKTVAAGHSLSVHDWQTVFETLGIDFRVTEVPDIMESEHYHS